MKTHSFRLLKNDYNIEKILEAMEGKKKAEFIRTALKFYIKYGDSLENIENKIEEITTVLKNGAISFSREDKQNHIENLNQDSNPILRESIQSLLEL